MDQVESILEEKPDNPVLYMVQHLLEQYPHETILITQNMRQPEEEAIPDTPRTEGLEENSDDDDDEEDDTTDKVRRKQRAMAISGESLNPADLKELLEDIPVHEKTPEVSEALMATVSKSPFLGNLHIDEQRRIVSAFKPADDVPAGQDIITFGEFGDVLYLVERGQVDVLQVKGGEETLVHTYDPGSTFGELAILYNSPRAATCRARTACSLWTLDRYSFKVLALAACIQRRELYMLFLGGVPLLSSLSAMELMALADAIREEEYAAEEVVCSEGERGNFFAIIRQGEALVTQKEEEGGEKVIASLKEGKYFGEIALITDKPRTASVRCAPKQVLKVLTIGEWRGGKCVHALLIAMLGCHHSRGGAVCDYLLTCHVDRATFKRILGPLEDILRRNMETYNDFFSQGI